MNKENNKLSFLYCFDKNYNMQAFTSIISLLDNVTEEIEIYIIHKDQNDLVDIPFKILNHEKLINIIIYTFKDLGHNFPKLQNAHVSEATYYRLFIQNYLPNNIKNIIYLDADTVIINDPIKSFREHLKKMSKSNILFSARTELDKSNLKNYNNEPEMHQIYPFERLGIEGLYFNAGVLLINYSLWIELDVGQKLVNKMYELKNNIIAWDQDVLNAYSNGNYLNLTNELNTFDTEISHLNDNTKILHYLGSKKPWTTSGIFKYNSEFYHHNFRKNYKEFYHITHKWKLQSLKDLIINLSNFKILKLKHPYRFLLEFIKSVLKA